MQSIRDACKGIKVLQLHLINPFIPYPSAPSTVKPKTRPDDRLNLSQFLTKQRYFSLPPVRKSLHSTWNCQAAAHPTTDRMAGSSPARPDGNQWASPSSRSVISDILAGDRNSEARHRLLIEAARREHERVREEAERVYQEHLWRQEQERLIEERKKEEERIRQQEQLAAERRKINALKAKKVEIPAILPDPEPVKAPPPAPKPASTPTPSQPPATQVNGSSLFGKTPGTQAAPPPAAPNGLGLFGQNPTSAPPATAALKQTTPTGTTSSTASNLFSGNNTQVNGVTTSATVAKPPTPAPVQQGPDRLTVIHKNLKELRKSMLDQAKANPALKSRMGDMRREIRKCVGQLTGGGAGVNRQQVLILTSLCSHGLVDCANRTR